MNGHSSQTPEPDTAKTDPERFVPFRSQRRPLGVLKKLLITSGYAGW
jgi:hypothetical protein